MLRKSQEGGMCLDLEPDMTIADRVVDPEVGLWAEGSACEHCGTGHISLMATARGGFMVGTQLDLDEAQEFATYLLSEVARVREETQTPDTKGVH